MKRSTATVDCPKSMVGRVIGKNGETIKALQTYSGALIQIDQTCDPTKVTISGTPHSLNLAVSMVSDIVKGTFKGFALLRQLGHPLDPREPSVPAPRPVYAPGYGLIPPNQVRTLCHTAASECPHCVFLC
jgi:rRNA processing protein Krr1/Pno1